MCEIEDYINLFYSHQYLNFKICYSYGSPEFSQIFFIITIMQINN